MGRRDGGRRKRPNRHREFLGARQPVVEVGSEEVAQLEIAVMTVFSALVYLLLAEVLTKYRTTSVGLPLLPAVL